MSTIPRPLRFRRISVLGTLSVLVSVVLSVLTFFVPSANAAGVVPLLACVGSSICSPEGPAIMAELAAQGGTAGSTLSAAEAASFQGIVNGYGATATTSGSAIAASAAAGGSTSFGPILTGAGTALLSGGVSAWAAHVGSSDALGTLPTPAPGVTYGFKYNDTTSYGSAPSGTPTSVTLGGSGNASSVSFSATYSRTDQGDYGCKVEVLYRPSGQSMPSTFAALGSAETAGTAARYTVRSYGFGNGNHCTSSAATFSAAAAGRGSINSAWVIVGVGIQTWNFTSGIVAQYSSWWAMDAAAPSNPNRYVQQTITCTNSSGGTSTVTNSTGAIPWSPGDMVTVAGMMCPAGTRLTSWQADVKTSGAADTTLGSNTSVSHPSAGCDYVGGTLCTARVTHRVTSSTGTSWETCHVAGGACAQWWTDPARDTNYRCEYGAGSVWTVVGIGVCSIFRNSFPADPVTNPPTVDPAVPPTVGRNPGDCDMSWSDVLSGAIVFKAVSCALQWAFVPSPDTLTAVQTQVSTAWDGTAPAVVIGAVSDVYEPFRGLADASSSPDCNGPEVDWEWGYLDHAHPFATCDGLPKTMSDYFRPILGAVVLLGALGQAARTLAGTISLPTPKAVA